MTSTTKLQELHDMASKLLEKKDQLPPRTVLKLLRQRYLLASQLRLRKRYPHLDRKQDDNNEVV